ncbi:MAG: hypothetical protein ACXWL2_00640 [Candidatus Chromulinivorax sp.]
MKILIFLFILPIHLYTSTSEDRIYTTFEKLENETPIQAATLMVKIFQETAKFRVEKEKKQEASLLIEFAKTTKDNIEKHENEYLKFSDQSTTHQQDRSGRLQNKKTTLRSNLDKLEQTINNNLNSTKSIEDAKYQIIHCNKLLEEFSGYLRAFNENYRFYKKNNNDDPALIKRAINTIGQADVKIESRKRNFEDENQNNPNKKRSI